MLVAFPFPPTILRCWLMFKLVIYSNSQIIFCSTATQPEIFHFAFLLIECHPIYFRQFSHASRLFWILIQSFSMQTTPPSLVSSSDLLSMLSVAQRTIQYKAVTTNILSCRVWAGIPAQHSRVCWFIVVKHSCQPAFLSTASSSK